MAQKSRRLNWYERILLALLWSFCWLFGRLPHFVQFHIVARAIKFVFYYLIHYRQRVIDQNLKNSFPEKSAEELRKIRSEFYTYLSEVFVSTFALSNRSSSTNLFPKSGSGMEIAAKLRDEVRGRSWVALTGHYGLWEYFVFWSTFSDQRLIGVYHTLKSPLFDVLFKRLRRHYKVSPMPANESLRFTLRNGASFRGESYVMGLIADQSPRRLPRSYWHTFLGQDTIFYDGGEKIAMRSKLPVYFIFQQRVSRGRYSFGYRLIWDGVEEVEPNEITRRYVAMLEDVIRLNPSLWLWSHRRWKAKRN